MLSYSLIKESFECNRCIKSRELLSESEYGFSRNSINGIYTKNINQKDKKYINYFLDEILNNKDDILSWDEKPLDNLYKFFNLLCNIQSGSIEKILHVFLYIFWDSIQYEHSSNIITGKIVHMGNGKVILDNQIKNEKWIVEASKKILSIGIQIDLISFDLKNKLLFLIEVKNDQFDDKAIGQILRYYNLISERFLYVNRKLDIQYIKPTIIMYPQEVGNWIDKWLALPIGFRDVIEIFNFKNNKLYNNRKRILSAISKNI